MEITHFPPLYTLMGLMRQGQNGADTIRPDWPYIRSYLPKWQLPNLPFQYPIKSRVQRSYATSSRRGTSTAVVPASYYSIKPKPKPKMARWVKPRASTKSRSVPRRSMYGRTPTATSLRRAGYKRTYSKRPKTAPKKSLMKKRYSVARLPRDWPPSRMIVTFENNFRVDTLGKAANNVSSYSLWQLSGAPNGASMARYIAGDAAGTRTLFTAQTPRNWTKIVPDYKRGRLMKTSYKFTVELPETDDVHALTDWTVFSWFSSDLDTSNPLTALNANSGSAQPWALDQVPITSARHILETSRRVKKQIIKAAKNGIGGGQRTFTFTTGYLKDRVGNVVVGGKHARTATNAPGGQNHASDVDVASLLINASGLDNKINIVLTPTRINTAIFAIQHVAIRRLDTVELYDRVV